LKEDVGITPKGIASLMVVYIVWGSTYLAIRVAVQEGSGFPPFTMALIRVTIAGILLLIWSALVGKKIRPSRSEFGVLLGSGILLWTGGNGLVTWAEQRAASGLAALIVASMPLWVTLIEAVLERRVPSVRLMLALLIGFAGIGVLSTPELQQGAHANLMSIFALLGASLSWAVGTVLQGRRPVSLSPQVSAGYQSLAGAVGFAVLVVLTGEPRPAPTVPALFAVGYLTIFGSIVAFTAYVTTLRTLPMSVAMTYAYVNPVIAVFLGNLILHEPITVWTVTGAALVVLGVAGVFRARYISANYLARQSA
jgi:drug/metabolite transporter (DMT)-like permease